MRSMQLLGCRLNPRSLRLAGLAHVSDCCLRAAGVEVGIGENWCLLELSARHVDCRGQFIPRLARLEIARATLGLLGALCPST